MSAWEFLGGAWVIWRTSRINGNIDLQCYTNEICFYAPSYTNTISKTKINENSNKLERNFRQNSKLICLQPNHLQRIHLHKLFSTTLYTKQSNTPFIPSTLLTQFVILQDSLRTGKVPKSYFKMLSRGSNLFSISVFFSQIRKVLYKYSLAKGILTFSIGNLKQARHIFLAFGLLYNL